MTAWISTKVITWLDTMYSRAYCLTPTVSVSHVGMIVSSTSRHRRPPSPSGTGRWTDVCHSRLDADGLLLGQCLCVLPRLEEVVDNMS